jgi:hypothetical protein
MRLPPIENDNQDREPVPQLHPRDEQATNGTTGSPRLTTADPPLEEREGRRLLVPQPPPSNDPDTSEETDAIWEKADELVRAVATPRAVQDARRNEDRAMREQYPGEYVAYLEAESTAVRTVLAHDRSLKVVHAALANLPEDTLNSVTVTHYDPPAEVPAFRGPNRVKQLTPMPPHSNA